MQDYDQFFIVIRDKGAGVVFKDDNVEVKPMSEPQR
jgi:hypothetical protein